MRALVLAVVLGLAACVDDAPREGAAEARSVATLDEAFDACADGAVASGVDGVEALLDGVSEAEVRVQQALCRWLRFDETGDAADGEAAEAALTDALDHARADGADDAALARIYSHRAALRRALDADWPATLADLDAAVAADTARAIYVLDRAVARAQRGDSASAVRDLDRYLGLDSVDTARIDFARELREDVTPAAARP